MKVYVGLPMYGGAHGLAVRCLLTLQKALFEKHEALFDIVTGGSILPKVRNGIVKRFLDSGSDVLLFLDSDMCYDPATIIKLIESPFDVSVANYRKRHNDVQFLAEGTIKDGEWIKTHRAGTGIMAIKRSMIEKMLDKYPFYNDQERQIPCLFDFQMKDGEYHGEDYTFCQRVEEQNGEIYIFADCFTGHIGDTVYGANYSEHLRG